MKYTIDAKNQKIGRVASEAASILLGKKSASFAKNVATKDTVEILNAGALDMSVKKLTDDTYITYTGHRGGLNSASLGELLTKRGVGEVLRRAIYGMLPNNKLRSQRIMNLTIKK